MYLHIGLDKLITCDEIVGIFDLDNTTVCKSTRDYLSKAEKDGLIEYICSDLPKSFIISGKDGRKKVYITQLSVSTLKKRIAEGVSEL